MIIIIISVDEMKINLTVCSRGATQMKRWKNDDLPWQLAADAWIFFFTFILSRRVRNYVIILMQFV